MATSEKKNQFRSIQSLFLQKSIKRMKDLEDLFPTAVAKSLKINHSRYIQKLYKPDTFTIKQIKDLAALLELDPRLILDVILNQPGSATVTRKKSK
jgi:hypothetical protein